MRKGSFCAAVGLLVATPLSLVYAQSPFRYLGEPGQPPVVIHGTVESSAHAQGGPPTGSSSAGANLYYHGGISDGGAGRVGVETTPKVFLVFWGAQWSSDPSSEAATLDNFLSTVGASAWLNTVTQYCEGIASGTSSCSNATLFAGNPSSILGGVWYDNASNAPSHPRQSQLASEAVKAAGHFAALLPANGNASVQYVIATAHNNNSSGFGSQYCAWHSTATSSAGYIAYTNLPYITDAGASCGANFNGLAANAGITIVEGHEMAETMTDQFPNGGWLDSGGAEIGDKCAWNSATSAQPIGVTSVPVQPLWSNAANGGAGGCVLSYP